MCLGLQTECCCEVYFLFLAVVTQLGLGSLSTIKRMLQDQNPKKTQTWESCAYKLLKPEVHIKRESYVF